MQLMWSLTRSQVLLHIVFCCPRRQDIEVELDRFEGARSAMLQKYSLMERPRASLQEQLRVAVDAIAVLSLGEDYHPDSLLLGLHV